MHSCLGTTSSHHHTDSYSSTANICRTTTTHANNWIRTRYLSARTSLHRPSTCRKFLADLYRLCLMIVGWEYFRVMSPLTQLFNSLDKSTLNSRWTVSKAWSYHQLPTNNLNNVSSNNYQAVKWFNDLWALEEAVVFKPWCLNHRWSLFQIQMVLSALFTRAFSGFLKEIPFLWLLSLFVLLNKWIKKKYKKNQSVRHFGQNKTWNDFRISSITRCWH